MLTDGLPIDNYGASIYDIQIHNNSTEDNFSYGVLDTIWHINIFSDEPVVIGNTIRDIEDNTVYNKNTGETYD